VCEEEKKESTGQDRTGKKVKNGYISPIWGEAPTEATYIIKMPYLGNGTIDFNQIWHGDTIQPFDVENLEF